MKKFKETGLVTNIEGTVHHRFVLSAEDIAIVRESVAKDPTVSISRRFQVLALSYGTLSRILYLDLHLYPYKVQLTTEAS